MTTPFSYMMAGRPYFGHVKNQHLELLESLPDITPLINEQKAKELITNEQKEKNDNSST